MPTNTKPLVAALRISLITATLAVTLSACGSTKWGFPYRADIQQGNWLTAMQVAQLEPGMSRAQVRYILGTPVLQDVFHTDRWDYTYYNKPGYGKEELRQFTVWFDGDTLVRWDGDKQPDRQPFERTDTGAFEDSAPQPNAEDFAIEETFSSPGQPLPLPVPLP